MTDTRQIQEQNRWFESTGDRRCEAMEHGQRCQLIKHHDASMNATPHLFPYGATEADRLDAEIVDAERFVEHLKRRRAGLTT